MSKTLVDFFNSFGLPLGTWIAIIISAITFISGLIISIKKVKKKYDAKLKKRLAKQEEDRKFKSSMKEVVNTVNKIQGNIDAFIDENREIHNKLDEMWNNINESRNESKDGDKALEKQIKEQMKKYEETFDDIKKTLKNMDEKTTLIIESDKEGIKSYITDKYYQAINDKYIELHVLQALELRYEKYLQENGNTYVGRLMAQLRQMPNTPPDKD